eukprot:3195660-Rhodomonas_salina.1
MRSRCVASLPIAASTIPWSCATSPCTTARYLRGALHTQLLFSQPSHRHNVKAERKERKEQVGGNEGGV